MLIFCSNYKNMTVCDCPGRTRTRECTGPFGQASMTHSVCHFFYEFRWTGQDWRMRRLSRRGGVKMCRWKRGEDKWQMRHRKFHVQLSVCVCAHAHDEGKGWQTYDVIKWHVVYQAIQQMGPVVEKCVCARVSVCVCEWAAHRDTFAFRSDVALIGPKDYQVQAKRSRRGRQVCMSAVEDFRCSVLRCDMISSSSGVSSSDG